jgi:hypothetical protein
MKQKNLTVELISTSDTETHGPRKTSGWGKDGSIIEIKGEVAQIFIRRKGESEFSVRILEDGSIIVTNYKGVYTQTVDSNLRLTNTRPWK